MCNTPNTLPTRRDGAAMARRRLMTPLCVKFGDLGIISRVSRYSGRSINTRAEMVLLPPLTYLYNGLRLFSDRRCFVSSLSMFCCCCFSYLFRYSQISCSRVCQSLGSTTMTAKKRAEHLLPHEPNRSIVAIDLPTRLLIALLFMRTVEPAQVWIRIFSSVETAV